MEQSKKVLLQSSPCSLSSQESEVSHESCKLHDAITKGVQELLEAYEETERHLVGYHLARKVKGLLLDYGFDLDNVQAKTFIRTIRQACEEVEAYDEDVDKIIGTYLGAYPMTTTPEGYDQLTEAMRRADKISVVAMEQLRLGRNAYRLAKLAYCLSKEAAESFVLPQHRIAVWLGIQQQTVSAILVTLQAEEVLICTDATFSLKGHKAKEYRFVYQPK